MSTLSNGPLSPGTVIDDKFQIETVLGEGAMGLVVRALHLKLGTPVALKFLLPRMLGDRVIVERFAREAQAAARLTSEHVARVLDVGTGARGAPYMVMEYLSGETLGAALKRRRTLAVNEACSYMIQVCDALTEAHALDIVHRDLKLDNLFLTTRPNGKTVVKVLDFGISKMASSSGDELTLASSILGTPLYMAPEQLSSSRTVDGRADVWSCGVCLYRMLGGQPPFDASSIVELGAKLLTESPPDLRTLRPEVSPELAAIVHRCLERDVTQRWQSATELSDALERFAQGIPAGSGSNPVMSSPAPRISDAPPDDRTAKVRKRERPPLSAEAAAAAALTPSEGAMTIARALDVNARSIVDATLNPVPLSTPAPEPPQLGVMRPSRPSGPPAPPYSVPLLEPEERTRVVQSHAPMRHMGPGGPPGMPPSVPPTSPSSRYAPTVTNAPAPQGPVLISDLAKHPFFGVGLVFFIAVLITLIVLFAHAGGCFG